MYPNFVVEKIGKDHVLCISTFYIEKFSLQKCGLVLCPVLCVNSQFVTLKHIFSHSFNQAFPNIGPSIRSSKFFQVFFIVKPQDQMRRIRSCIQSRTRKFQNWESRNEGRSFYVSIGNTDGLGAQNFSKSYEGNILHNIVIEIQLREIALSKFCDCPKIFSLSFIQILVSSPPLLIWEPGSETRHNFVLILYIFLH